MKNVVKATKIVANILEVLHWLAAGVMALVAVCALAAPQWLTFTLNPASDTGTAVVYGFEMTLTDSAGQLNVTALFLAALCAVLLYLLMAMIFRNIRLIIKRSESGSPFQKNNIRMVREIGIFSIAMPVIGLISSIIIPIATGSHDFEMMVRLDGFVTGIVVLSLTQFFVYGAQLERDVDGLL